MKVSAHAITFYPVESKPALSKENGLYIHEGKPDDTLLGALDSARGARDRAVWGAFR